MSRSCCASIFIIFILCTSLSERARGQSVSFVQVTDAHLYDAGKRRVAEGVQEEALDNRGAFYWAILETNRLEQSGKRLDFLVFTGDFGLEEVRYKTAADCVDSQKPPGTIRPTLEEAGAEVAQAFSALTINKIFLVPGNNDLCGEDPKDSQRFRDFVSILQLKAPSKEIIDLTQTAVVVNQIHIHGLNSATFKNAKPGLRETNRIEQIHEMERLRSEITPGVAHIIFTHIPDLEDPFRGAGGEDIRLAWNVDTEVSRIWEEINGNPQVLGVFAGHFHDARRVVYTHDFSWAKNKPDIYTTNKTWVSPPLAIKNQDQSESPSRGFLVVTLTTNGKTLVVPEWYPFATQKPSADKSEKLIEGDENSLDGKWDKAAAAYSQALSSSDPSVRSSAERGFRSAHRNMRGYGPWFWKTDPYLGWFVRHLGSIFCAGLLLVICICIRSLWSSKPRSWNPLRWRTIDWQPRRGSSVVAPAKLTPDAPAELFGAELVQYAEEARQVWEEAATSWMVGLSSFTLAGSSAAFQQMADSIPDVGQIKLGKVATFFFTIFQYFGWRVESGIALAEKKAIGMATLRWAWVILGRWKHEAVVGGTMEIGPMVARPLAYNIVGQQYLRQKPQSIQTSS